MERYAEELKSVPEEEKCLSVNHSALLKMPRTVIEDIVFRDRDSDGLLSPTVDPMVVTVGIGPAIVRKVLVDTGASVNVLF